MYYFRYHLRSLFILSDIVWCDLSLTVSVSEMLYEVTAPVD